MDGRADQASPEADRVRDLALAASVVALSHLSEHFLLVLGQLQPLGHLPSDVLTAAAKGWALNCA